MKKIKFELILNNLEASGGITDIGEHVQGHFSSRATAFLLKRYIHFTPCMYTYTV